MLRLLVLPPMPSLPILSSWMTTATTPTRFQIQGLFQTWRLGHMMRRKQPTPAITHLPAALTGAPLMPLILRKAKPSPALLLTLLFHPRRLLRRHLPAETGRIAPAVVAEGGGEEVGWKLSASRVCR